MKGVFCVVLVTTFALVGGAQAATAAPAPNPLNTAKPKALCGAQPPTIGGPVAHCLAYGLANSAGHLLRLKASAMPRRDGKARSNLVAAPNGNGDGTLFPGDLNTAYGLPETTPGSSSQVIAIVDAYDNPNAKSDLDASDRFWRSLGIDLPDLPACASPTAHSCFMKVNQNGASSPLPQPDPTPDRGWALENSLDVQAVHSVCHDCKIILVEANSPRFDDLAAAENEAVALGATIITNSYGDTESDFLQSEFDALAAAYRHPGVIITASTGDDGFAGGTQFPADVKDVVAVGGTTLSTNPVTSAYVGESAWFALGSGAGSGCSVFQTPQLWQSGAIGWAATGCNTERAVADVSADADPSTGLWVWSTYAAFCPANADPNVASCFFPGVGGTSLASPIIAATYGLAANSRLDNAAMVPYGHSGNLHDVTSGSTGSCGGTTICQASVGYDGPTGIGTPQGLLGFKIAAPTLTSFSPADGFTGSTVTILGQFDLGQVSSVTVGGTPVQSFNVVSSTEVTAVLGAGSSGPVAVTTPGGTATSSAQFQFVAPSITSFTPKGGGVGTTVTITGLVFTGATAVKFGGTPATSFNVDSDTQITAVTAPGTNTGPVSVTGPGGTVTSSTPFYGPPSISSVNPGHDSVHGSITITGTNLTGASQVKVNGATAPFHVVSASQITLTVPSGAAASGTVQVTTPGGNATSGAFTVDPPPAITSFGPGAGAVGQTITIFGSNLDGTVGVRLGSIITVPTSVSSAQVTFTIPPGAVTGTITILATSGTATSATQLTVTG